MMITIYTSNERRVFLDRENRLKYENMLKIFKNISSNMFFFNINKGRLKVNIKELIKEITATNIVKSYLFPIYKNLKDYAAPYYIVINPIIDAAARSYILEILQGMGISKELIDFSVQNFIAYDNDGWYNIQDELIYLENKKEILEESKNDLEILTGYYMSINRLNEEGLL